MLLLYFEEMCLSLCRQQAKLVEDFNKYYSDLSNFSFGTRKGVITLYWKCNLSKGFTMHGELTLHA